ncbi:MULTISPECIES: GNAT family N-acetyltransferase [unclassified Microbacterium]|uniref:GNAT family N-acetyltransferase n=1 Tax=unclassified Microbacterium TaxID=2609290 RepID=UPI00301AF423
MRLRPFRQGDEDDLADVCLRTGDAGADATGLYRSSGLLADVFALPYAAWHPEGTFVVDDGRRVVGYVVCAPDTAAFERWFQYAWWPPREPRHRSQAGDSERDATMLAYARAVGTRAASFVDRYPAHLHIDLLPEVQGQGWGRRLIDALAGHLWTRGVDGVQLTAGARNSAAIAFYRRLGFDELGADHGGVTFGMPLDETRRFT